MGESDDIKQLLSEIRDIQRAHYERYVAFTEQVLELERRHEMNTAEAKAFREEVRQTSRRAQGHLVITGVALLVFVITISALFSLIPYLIGL